MIIFHVKGIKLHVVIIFVWNKMPTSFWFALIHLNENMDEKVGESAFVTRILSCFLLITRRVQQKIVSGPTTFLRDNDLGTYQEWTLLPNIYDNTYPLLNPLHYKAYSLFLSNKDMS